MEDNTSESTLMARCVEADALIALCCLLGFTDQRVYVLQHNKCPNQDTFVNELQNTNPVAVGKIKSRGNSSSCICLRTPADSADEIFPQHQICSNSFLPSYFPPKQHAHASIAKALSGFGLILVPKCFTANVITSS